MHSNFPQWVKSLELGDDPDARQRRWAGTSALVNDADDELVEVLVRLALKSKQEPSRAQKERVQNLLRGADSGFSEQGNTKEVQVLAAAALAVLMDEKSGSGGTAALSILTATFDGAVKLNPPFELLALAKKAVAAIGEQERKRPDMSDWKISGEPDLGLDEDLKNLEADSSLVLETFRAMNDAFTSALASQDEHLNGIVNGLTPFIRAQDEELDMLWWVIGERSLHLKSSFSTVAVASRPVVFARELADLTTLFPGPASIIALLSRTGIGSVKKQTLASFVNAVSDEWVKEYIDEYEPSPVTAPIHLALKCRMQSGAGDAWIAGWASVVGVDIGISFSPISLGTLFYNECLLRRFAE